MNMPGFTAEASLRSTTSVYRTAASIVSKTDAVQMQMFFCMGNRGEVCCQCWDDGSNCHCRRRPLPELFPRFPQPGELPQPEFPY